MFSCSPEYKGLISIVWPDAKIFEDTLPFFIPRGRIVFYSDKPLTEPDDRIIQVTKEQRNVELSTRPGLMEAVKAVSGGLEDWEFELLNKFDTEEFWFFAKCRLIAPFQKKDFSKDKDSSVIELFDNLFYGFRHTYPIYVRIRSSYKSIMLALMTMMISAVRPKEKRYSPQYLDLLSRNSKYIDHFRKCVMSYVESRQTEQDFLTFLHEVCPYEV